MLRGISLVPLGGGAKPFPIRRRRRTLLLSVVSDWISKRLTLRRFWQGAVVLRSAARILTLTLSLSVVRSLLVIVLAVLL
jgi:hypothetical protein